LGLPMPVGGGEPKFGCRASQHANRCGIPEICEMPLNPGPLPVREREARQPSRGDNDSQGEVSDAMRFRLIPGQLKAYEVR
jgi:hypothetical protein